MALRLLHALAGLILGYGILHGPSAYNLVFDLGVVFAIAALVVALVTERSLRGSWPLLLTAAGFPAIVGLQTLGLPDCTGTLRPGTPCLVFPTGRTVTAAALALTAASLGLGIWDLRRP
jgi:hypothetical protein